MEQDACWSPNYRSNLPFFFKINSLPLNYNGMFMKMFIYFIFNTCISIQISSTLEDLYNLIMATTSKTS